MLALALALALAPIAAIAQAQASSDTVWQMQDSGTTTGLRGIDSVDGTVAWASGTGGTVLRTTDGGAHWTQCAVPDAEKDGVTLDFRGVQAWDATTAIVMASGPGDKSRLYKTSDGCRTWVLIAKNPSPNGFWDAVQAGDFEDPTDKRDEEARALILGDSVNGQLQLWEWKEGWEERELELSYQVRGKADLGEGSFAASNSVLQLARTPQVDLIWKYAFRFASGTAKHSYLSIARYEHTQTCEPCRAESLRVETPMAQNSESSGIFSLDFRSDSVGVVVGGDYKKPDGRIRTAAYSKDGGQSWKVSTTPPHGYRSAVQWSESLKLWITAGTNGSDISRDDGKTWQPLDNGNWNALSLPFVVGPNGRIARLSPAALPK